MLGKAKLWEWGLGVVRALVSSPVESLTSQPLVSPVLAWFPQVDFLFAWFAFVLTLVESTLLDFFSFLGIINEAERASCIKDLFSPLSCFQPKLIFI